MSESNHLPGWAKVPGVIGGVRYEGFGTVLLTQAGRPVIVSAASLDALAEFAHETGYPFDKRLCNRVAVAEPEQQPMPAGTEGNGGNEG